VVVIEIAHQQATLTDGVWDAPEDLREDLDALTAFVRRQPASGDYEPDPDLRIVRAAEELLHASILHYEPPTVPKGTVS
jgi:hypothetical protein